MNLYELYVYMNSHEKSLCLIGPRCTWGRIGSTQNKKGVAMNLIIMFMGHLMMMAGNH